MENEQQVVTTSSDTQATETDSSKVASEVEEVEDETDVDVEFDDDEDEVANHTEEESKPTQPRETRNQRNSRYAKARREGMLEVLDHTNPYTNSKMETQKDIEIYENMKAMEKQGLDPLNTTDYINFMAEKEAKLKAEKEAENQAKQQQIAQQQAMQQRANERMNKELAEFNAKYPNVDLNKWLGQEENALQSKVFAGLLKSGMTALESYENVMNLYNSQTFDSAQKIAKQTVQNNLASPGSQTDGEETSSSNNISQMTDAQFKAYWKKKYG